MLHSTGTGLNLGVQLFQFFQDAGSEPGPYDVVGGVSYYLRPSLFHARPFPTAQPKKTGW